MNPNILISVIGAILFAAVGAFIQHVFSHGGMSYAMGAAPTVDSTSLGALLGSLTSLFVPLSTVFSKLIPIIQWLTSAKKQIEDAVPTKLFTDLAQILLTNHGTITLGDIETLIADFSQVDPGIIFNLIREAVAIFQNKAANNTDEGGDAGGDTPQTPQLAAAMATALRRVGPAPGTTPQGDVPVIV